MQKLLKELGLLGEKVNATSSPAAVLPGDGGWLLKEVEHRRTREDVSMRSLVCSSRGSRGQEESRYD